MVVRCTIAARPLHRGIALEQFNASAVPFRHRDEAKRAEMTGRREPKAGDTYN
jgi:hypothetical protein